MPTMDRMRPQIIIIILQKRLNDNIRGLGRGNLLLCEERLYRHLYQLSEGSLFSHHITFQAYPW
jgi:hypothetical protein